MILLWGLPGDRPLAMVRDALDRIGSDVAFLDQRDVFSTEVQLAVGSDVVGTLRTRNWCIDLQAVNAAYLRPYDSRRIPSVVSAGPQSRAWRKALSVEETLMSWADLTPALVVNRPSAMAFNSSKPYQAELIRSLGFLTPATLITTCPRAALEFWKRHETVIYKSVSSIRSIVSRLTPEDSTRIDDVVWCPTQLQQYIPGIDYRAHVVGREIFACRVESGADDYRYSGRFGATVKMEACDLPQDVARRSYAVAKSMQLIVAGVDLRCTPDGDWYCFEVNPSPGFTFFQDMTHEGIDEAIARVLVASEVRPSISAMAIGRDT